jgi:hypothetical protein
LAAGTYWSLPNKVFKLAKVPYTVTVPLTLENPLQVPFGVEAAGSV